MPSEIKIFTWQLANDSNPTEGVKNHRNMATSPKCKICGADNDARDHALINCTMAKFAWTLVDEELTDVIASLNIVSPREWLFFLRENLNNFDFVKILVTCWAIWHARRKALHEEVFQSPLSTHSFIQNFFMEWETVSAKTSNGRILIQKLKETAPRWIPPPAECVKLSDLDFETQNSL